MESVPPYQHAVEVAGEVQKIKKYADGSVTVRLHAFNMAYVVDIPAPVVAKAMNEKGLEVKLGMNLRAMSKRDRKTGRWTALNIRSPLAP